MGALSHLKVLDLSRVLAGPWAGQILADLGAEVIKVERPGSGDDTRGWGPPYMRDAQGRETGEATYFLAANRGKESICIDIKSPGGQETVRRLARRCDVLIENFKVGDTARFGLDYATLARDNPRLVYCSITGFGQTGPLRHRPGYDFIVQAMGGLMSVTGSPDDPAGPQKVGVALSDIMTGMYATVGILAALAEREQSGKGQHVDLSLLDATVASLANQASGYLAGGVVPKRSGNAHPSIVPYQSFVVADGHIIVAVGNDTQFRRYAGALDEPALAEDSRFATNRARVENRDVLIPVLQKRMLERPRDEWLRILEEAGVPAAPINAMDDVFAEPQVRARGMQVSVNHPLNPALQLVGSPIRFSRTPVDCSRAPPLLGEHTEAVLARLGDETAG